MTRISAISEGERCRSEEQGTGGYAFVSGAEEPGVRGKAPGNEPGIGCAPTEEPIASQVATV